MEIVVRFWIWESIHLRAAKRRRSSLRLFGYGSEVTSSLTLLVNYILFCVKLCSDLSIRQTVHSGQTPAPDGKSEITSLRSWMQLVLCFWIWKSIHLRSAKRRRSSLRSFSYKSEITSPFSLVPKLCFHYFGFVSRSARYSALKYSSA